MKKSRKTQQIALFRRAAFQIDVESLRGRRLDLLLDETLARVFGGADTGTNSPATCTEFTCNLYAPPPPQ